MPDRRVRYWMVFLAMLVAVLLYLDRICLSTASESVEADLKLDKDQLKWILGAFFWTYAFAQLPAGWLGDRYGARWILSLYVLLWSLSTALLGFAQGAMSLLILRLTCGLFEAGAYPCCAGIVRRWVPATQRGLASSIVSIGGRLGGVVAPILTMELMLLWTYGGERWSVTDPDPAVTSWRPVMMFYGAAGILIAMVFVAFYRDHPEKHPLVGEEELKAIRGDSQLDNSDLSSSNAMQAADSTSNDTTSDDAQQFPIVPMLTNVSLWLMSFVQFASNFGWAFLVTLLPRYLTDVHHVSKQSQSVMQSVSLGAGIFGLLLGGWLTDWATRRFGLRWGRSVLLVASRLFAAGAFIGLLYSRDAVQATVCLAVVGFATDLGIGAVWAYGQDVGGRYAGSVLGWGNMWGNIGAALSPILLGTIAESLMDDPARGWQFAFISCTVIQFIAAAAAFGVTADKPLK